MKFLNILLLMVKLIICLIFIYHGLRILIMSSKGFRQFVYMLNEMDKEVSYLEKKFIKLEQFILSDAFRDLDKYDYAIFSCIKVLRTFSMTGYIISNKPFRYLYIRFIYFGKTNQQIIEDLFSRHLYLVHYFLMVQSQKCALLLN